MVDEVKVENGRLQKVVLTEICTEGTQTRHIIRREVVAEYAERIKQGEEFDPAVVYLGDDKKLRLSAGFHRKAAYALAGEVRMPCLVRPGSQWDALQYGLRDNLQHRGERLSRADQQHNIKLVLRERPGMSDRAIGELCGVSPSTVAKYRAPVQVGQVTQRVGRDGKVYDTANLERTPAVVPAPGPVPEPVEQVLASNGEQPTPPAAVPELIPAQAVPVGQQAEPVAIERVQDPAVVEPEQAQPDDDLPPDPPGPPADEAMLRQAFCEAVRSLGRAKKAVHDLAGLAPGTCYPATIGHLDRAGEELVRWQAELDAEPLASGR